MAGGQTALEVGFFAAVIATVIGTLYGAVAGLSGRVIDGIMMRFVDIVLSIPFLFIVLVLATKYSATVLAISLLLGFFSWLIPARLVRGEVLTLRERDFVAAARVMGSGRARLVYRHLIPNALSVVIVNITFLVADSILALAYLGFLGFGLQYPVASWGDMLGNADTYISSGQWWLVYPGWLLSGGGRDGLEPRRRCVARRVGRAVAAAVTVDARMTSGTARALEVTNLSTHIKLTRSTVKAVGNVDIGIDSGETLGLVGESGCGKSMLGLSILNLLPRGGKIIEGSVQLGGRELVGLSDSKLRKLRGNELAMIFQDSQSSLNPTKKIGEQVAEPVRLHRGASRAEAYERALEVLELVGLPRPRERMGNYPHQLSGGLRQRVMIAIALACEPKVLLADEPTTALDVTIQAQILALLDDLEARLGMATLLVTHDMGVVAGRADRVSVMYAGRIVETGPTKEIFGAMRHPYTQALLGSIPKLSQDNREALVSIRGLPPDLTNPPAGCRFAPRCPRATYQCRQEEPPLAAHPAHQFACCIPSMGRSSSFRRSPRSQRLQHRAESVPTAGSRDPEGRSTRVSASLDGREHRVVQPLHALLGARQPWPGLHPPGPRQGTLAASCALPPPAAQRLPAHDRACRALDSGSTRRQPARRGAVQHPRPGAAVLQRASER